MSYVCGVSQREIGRVYGISQYGVSKQVRGALKKLKGQVLKPERNSVRVRKDLDLLLPSYCAETVCLYYFLHMYSLTARLLGGLTEGAVRSRLRNSLSVFLRLAGCESEERYYKEAKACGVDGGDFEWGRAAAGRYYDYLKAVMEESSYGEHQFKKRVKKGGLEYGVNGGERVSGGRQDVVLEEEA